MVQVEREGDIAVGVNCKGCHCQSKQQMMKDAIRSEGQPVVTKGDCKEATVDDG